MPKYSQQELAEIQQRTEKIEAEREEKQREREEKRQLNELKKRRQFQEKLVAPFLLVLTIVISALIMLFSR